MLNLPFAWATRPILLPKLTLIQNMDAALSDPALAALDSTYFKLRLSCNNPNPIGDLVLNLIVTGRPPNPLLVLRSTLQSQIFYDQPLPRTAYAKSIIWQVPVVTGYSGIVYVACGDLRSNAVVFKKL